MLNALASKEEGKRNVDAIERVHPNERNLANSFEREDGSFANDETFWLNYVIRNG